MEMYLNNHGNRVFADIDENGNFVFFDDTDIMYERSREEVPMNIDEEIKMLARYEN